MKPLRSGLGISAFRGLLCAWFGLLVLFAAGSVSGQITLIATGSVWKYLDNGTDQGVAWRSLGFDDSHWASGPAQLGYGDGDEATSLSFGPDPNNKFITTYFRRQFTFSGLAPPSNLVVRLLRDDGGVIYLNNREIFRSNMPTGAVTFATLAPSAASGIDESNNFYSAIISPSFMVPGPNIVAVEIHQNATNSSDLSFDLELIGSLNTLPPVVSLAQPLDGEQVMAGANRLVSANVSDPDGIVVRVDFFVDGLLRWRDTNTPFEFMLGDIPPGGHALTAIAFDNSGANATSPPVRINASIDPGLVPLVPNSSVWKYFDQGIDLGPAWQRPEFIDSTWPSGPAELGFGDSADTPPRPERTPINLAGRQYITTYFRRVFSASDPTNYANLILRLLRDDGAVVYLNGNEVFRSNMDPTLPIFFNTPASGVALDDGTNYFETVLDPSLLKPGPNLLAVEVHQSSLTSSDISFDLMLLGVPNTPRVALLTNQCVAIGGRIQFHADATGAPPLAFQWQLNGVDLMDDGVRIFGAQSPDLFIQPAFPQDAGNFVVIVHNPFGVATAQANVNVVGPPFITLQPISQTAPFCSDVTFKVDGGLCVSWQWFRNGVLLPGATNATLLLTNVQRPEVGLYWAVASNPAGVLQSVPAELQILLRKVGTVTNALYARDDMNSLPPAFGGFAPASAGSVPTLPLLHGVPLLFTTYGATVQPGEPTDCVVGGGHSKWAYYYSTRTEPLRISTEGSDFDTVLAVYTNKNNVFYLQACTNDSNGKLTSVVRFPGTSGLPYYIKVDGVGPAVGTVRLQVGEGTLNSPMVSNGQFQFSMSGHGGRTYRLQTSTVASSNAANWASVLTTSVPPSILDWVLLYRTNITAEFPRRYYRGTEE